ncbi:Glu/Leu/Phe/Val dehydrogenase dimerization domain-containing protein [Plantactinospora sp. KLBMP9567]|uniref:Glu/Leu/Phe/Val dehydrogenase dimerization domain-containing protein n=1 Tax=Plantactinospora sp. KLBMP9567 TaxID=3085900 RepID=UPI0029821571|nr:Glu/Leu/Phe/Val dehydrogenase dimerization domain-containing protein [Plantactinospora sp. KLBMP9567]MDW5324385.1 Glu/Leu/Phe/Val dehydrogenase dimerization domain-containing protein [Plantactinospora sp. KLBMP9567]
MVTSGIDTDFTHEHVVVGQGARSGLPIVVAVHSTKLGQAIGGCRLAPYPDWRAGLTDALRLSAAMSDKCALAGLPNGGGKAVVALPLGSPPNGTDRTAVLHDVGDVIAGLAGSYATGPDVGTGPDDMVTIAERTPYAFCRPVDAGGSGDSSEYTAVGVLAALHALCSERFGSDDLSRRSFAVLGLGRVGSHVLRMLTDAGATLVASDIDESLRPLAEAAGAAWVSPQECLTADVEVLVPAALGGLLTARTVPALRCAAIAGPANNQLDTPATADLLHQRGILWAPDVVVSAGGIIHATAVELLHETSAQAAVRVRGIADTLAGILRTARTTGSTPAEAARSRARRRMHGGRG